MPVSYKYICKTCQDSGIPNSYLDEVESAEHLENNHAHELVVRIIWSEDGESE